MKCENTFCIYQDEGKCSLDDICLDNSGMCSDCIYVSMDKDIIFKAKEEILQRLKGYGNDK